MHAEHVAGKAGRRIAGRLDLLGLQPAAHILRLGGGVERLGLGLLELALKLGEAVVLGKLGRLRGGFLADVLGFVVQIFVIVHFMNLVRAWAVKSTMGTTRA